MVGPETHFGTIVEGNANKDGARITVTPNDIAIYVKVARTGLWGAPGKFKAIYRVFWEPGPPLSPGLVVTVQPYPVPLATPIQITVSATDRDTQAPVVGTVSIGGHAAASTNVAFTYTFTRRRVRSFDTDLRRHLYTFVYPTGTVTVSGYPEVEIDFGFPT